MALTRRIVVTLGLWLLLCCTFLVEGKKKKKEDTSLQTKEATMGNFVGLLAMRLLYGLASWAGLGEWASGLFNGALKPPNSDYDDYYGGDYGGGDDYDY